MVLMVFIEAEDNDGWSDLDRAVFNHPDGTSYNADADTYTDEFNDTNVLRVPFHMDTNTNDETRQFAMTGYRVELFDKAGNSVSQDFDVFGFEGEAVPLGTQMVHPKDYTVNGSGGDYRSGLGFSKVESVTVNADDVTITDDRVNEVAFYFADSEETFGGSAP